MRWRLATILFLLAAAITAGAVEVHGQSFLGTGPAERLTLPPSGGNLSRPAQKPNSEQTIPAVPTGNVGMVPPTSLSVPRRLAAGTRGFRLSGEADSLRFPVFLTAGQARSGARLRLSYLSAISVAPEVSDLVVRVNGAKIGWTRIQAPGAVKMVEFAVPDGNLRPGYNAIEFTAHQRHRVDCSVDATYELWTQIDASRTGLLVPAAGADLNLATLAALEPNETGALPLRLMVHEKPGLGRLQRMVEAVQAVALVGRLARPAVEFGPPLAGRSGLNLIVGTFPEIRTMDGLAALGEVAGPKLALLPARAELAPILVVTGASDGDVAEAIRTLAASGTAAQSTGDVAGIVLARQMQGYEVWGGETLTLGKLGLASQEFDGRLLRTRFELRFPADFVPADYGKVMLHLAGASAAGLSPDAKVVVDVNGHNAASVPLAYEKGELFNDNAIPIPLGMWRPGLNRIDISARIPIQSDKGCGLPGTRADKARFLFLDRTRIEVPQLARAVRSPDLAAMKGGAIPFAQNAAAETRPRLVMPSLDKDSAAAAATIAAQLAIAAGKLLDFDLVPDAGDEGAAQLIVAPARTLDPRTLRQVGLDPERLRDAWSGRAETVVAPGQAGSESVATLDRLRRDLPARCALPPASKPVRVADADGDGAAPITTGSPRSEPETPARTAAETATIPTVRTAPNAARRDRGAISEDELVERWDERLREGPSTFEGVGQVWDRVKSGASEFLSDARSQIGTPPGDRNRLIEPRASMIVAESARRDARASQFVLVTAPNAWLLKASASCLVDPAVWSGLVGAAVALDASDGSLTVDAAQDVSIIETQPRSFGNLWLIIAAYFSLNPVIYVGAMLLVALGLGIATTALVRQVGRKSA